MGFRIIWGKASTLSTHRAIASDRIFQSMNRGQVVSAKKAPEIQASVISSFSKMYRITRGHWWTRWIQKIGLF